MPPAGEPERSLLPRALRRIVKVLESLSELRARDLLEAPAQEDDEDLLREQISPDQVRRAQVLSRCLDLGRLLDELG